MRVLVTGGNGFVGYHVERELNLRGHDVITPTRQELNLLIPKAWIPNDSSGRIFSGPSSVGLALIEMKCDAVVHLAAVCGGIGINKDNPGRFIYENLQMGINILDGARLAKIKKVVNLGTVCAYPKFTSVPFKESDLWSGYPEETNAPYGIAKKAIIEMGIAYHNQYGMNITNLLPANMAGEYDHFNEYSSHVIPAIIKKFERPQFKPVRDWSQIPQEQWIPDGGVIKFVELWGTGKASREFLYAGDCARAIALSLEKDTGPEPINLGTGREITIAELAAIIKDIGQYDADIVWDATKPDGQPRRSLDVSKAKAVLGWEATTSLEEIIKRTIEWYRANEK